MNHKPWQQGHFDGLCGIYSLLNSVMYLHHGAFTEEDCEKLFGKLIRESIKISPTVVCDGLDFEPLCDVAECLPAYLRDHHKAQIGFTRPFVGDEVESAAEFFEMLGEMVKDPHTCAIIGLGAPWDHWTVVTTVTKKAVRFSDSYGIKRFDKRVFSLEEGPEVIKVDFRETILITKK